MSEFDSDSRDTMLSEIHQLGDSRNILQSISDRAATESQIDLTKNEK